MGGCVVVVAVHLSNRVLNLEPKGSYQSEVLDHFFWPGHCYVYIHIHISEQLNSTYRMLGTTE